MREVKKSNGMTLSNYSASFLLLAIIILSAWIRYGLLDVPFERDEGEYAYAGQLILQGIPPYQQFYNMKLPGIYVAYAGLLAVFGQTHTGIHLGLLVINAATIILIFLLTKRILGPIAGLVAAAFFAELSIGQSVRGVFANSEHFVILPAIGGIILLLRGLDDDQPWMLFFGGLLLGTGFIMKQHGAAFIAFGGLYLLVDHLRKKPVDWLHLVSQCIVFILGVTVPYGLTCLILASVGVFDKFWFWTVDYAMAYSSQVPIEDSWASFTTSAIQIGGEAPLIWLLSFLGLGSLLWDKQIRKKWLFIVLFSVFSFSAICPGWFFRTHYFILLLPAVAMLGGISISSLSNKLVNSRFRIVKYGLPTLLTVVCLAGSVYQQRNFLFELTPRQVSRSLFGANPFFESLEIGRFIRENSKPNDRIAVIGSEPQIYFYSKRQSATGYIYMYALMENHDFSLQMQKEMIREVEVRKPKYLIFVKINTSWLRRPDSPKLVFDWFQSYQNKNYTLVGLVELYKDTTQYHWAPKAKLPPHSFQYIAVLEREKTM